MDSAAIYKMYRSNSKVADRRRQYEWTLVASHRLKVPTGDLLMQTENLKLVSAPWRKTEQGGDSRFRNLLTSVLSATAISVEAQLVPIGTLSFARISTLHRRFCQSQYGPARAYVWRRQKQKIKAGPYVVSGMHRQNMFICYLALSDFLLWRE